MRRSTLWISGLVFALLITAPLITRAGDWPRFRGPNGTGVSDGEVPAEWGPDENIKWAINLPGRGVSSPIVVGDKVFVTCYSGYGIDRNAGSMEDLKRHLLCIDRTTGNTDWEATVNAVLPEDPYQGAGTPAHGYASHTPASDGERVYAFFGKSGVLAFDMEGNQLWQTSVGTESGPQRWGSAASPAVYKDTVFVNASDESQALVALDAKTGKEKWRKEARMLDNTWSTPIVVESATGPEVTLAITGETWAFDADSGEFKWFAKGPGGRGGASHSLIPGEGVVYSLGQGLSVAVPTGGDGEVPDSELVWEGPAGARFATPILNNGLLFTVEGGRLSCFNAETGDRIYQSRLNSGGDDGGRGGRRRGRGEYASPVLAGENLIITTGNGTFYVVKATDSYELVSTNRITGDDSGFAATPAISDGDLFVRSHAKLYCISDD